MDADREAGDGPLWQRARGGDTAAFAVLFERHVDAVYAHCRRRGESVADAEDVTSLVFLEAWRRAGAVRIVNGSIRPWLLVVATNVLRNQWRARARHQRLLSRLPRDTEPDVADGVLADAEVARQRRALAQALGRLRCEEQEAVALCDLGAVSYAAAAAALGIPLGTLRSRLFRARRRLRQSLDEAAAVHRTPVDEPAVRR